MLAPKDIPQTALDAAMEALGYRRMPRSAIGAHHVYNVARSIVAAELRERERCAKIADAYAEVNWQSVTDSILLDPVLSNKGERPLTLDDWQRAEGMAVDGTFHSSMYHAATNIAAAIREGQQ